MTEISISRREFIGTSAVLAIAVTAGMPQANAQSGSGLPGSITANPRLDMWLRIGADGSVSVATGKAEIGQGIGTALAQIAADELDVAFTRISMVAPDTSVSPNEGRTVGSLSIQQSGSAIRIAAAQARGILLSNAAAQLNANRDQLEVNDGEISVRGSARSLTYWELIEDADFDVEISGAFEPKTADDYELVGKAMRRTDMPAKFFGGSAYLQDVRLPDMLHARIVRPALAPARLIETDIESAEAMPGVTGVVRNGSFLAVVAEREEQAIAAADLLRSNSRWDQSRTLPDQDDFPELLQQLESDTEVIFERGSATPAGAAENTRQFSAAYSRPYLAHASISPSAALAQFDGEQLTVWSHTQGVFQLRGAIATVLDFPESQIRCIHVPASGCYGQNGADDAGCDAAMIAMAMPGRPVRLQWSRHDEFQHEPYGSAMNLSISAQLDSTNHVTDWRYDLWSCTHSTRPGGGASAGNLLAAREKADPMSEPPRVNMRQPTGGGDRNSVALYSFPFQQVTKHFVTEHPLRVSALRGLGAYGNVFAIESFIDELAAAADADPIEFRLRHLEDSRSRAVLEKLAEELSPLQSAAGERSGRGIGFARYKNLGAWIAVAADVGVNENTGVISVRHATAVVDAGRIINPDGVRNQVEGGIVQSTSWTLKESVRFSSGGMQSTDWAGYPILRFSEVPEVDVVLLDRPSEAPLGAGEVSQGPMAAAIANAVAAAANVRLRQLPLTSASVLTALNA